MEACPCGSGRDFAECCQPFIQGQTNPETAEALMRSRYSAHVKSEVDYIYETTHPAHKKNCDTKSVAAWCRKAQWQSLEIVQTTGGGPQDASGTVEFIVRYREKEKPVKHHEIAEFERHEDRWYFKDGKAPQQEQVVRQGPKVGRNDPCPCGSGKKYKKCCL
ncbi:MAG: YchJ family protein [Desulfosarcinaceae bacterium]